jgi:hypothetical protein
VFPSRDSHEAVSYMVTNIATNPDPRIRELSVTDEMISAHLVDGRTISVPLNWSWRLSDATPEQRGRYQILGSGEGVRWPDLDEDISVEGMLFGIPARRGILR